MELQILERNQLQTEVSESYVNKGHACRGSHPHFGWTASNILQSSLVSSLVESSVVSSLV